MSVSSGEPPLGLASMRASHARIINEPPQPADDRPDIVDLAQPFSPVEEWAGQLVAVVHFAARAVDDPLVFQAGHLYQTAHVLALFLALDLRESGV